MKKQTVENRIQHKIPQLTRVTSLPETAKGVYANVTMIKHTEREFIFDFLLIIEEDAQLVSRVIMSPPHAHAFIDALKKNIERYDSTFEQNKKNEESDEVKKLKSRII